MGFIEARARKGLYLPCAYQSIAIDRPLSKYFELSQSNLSIAHA